MATREELAASLEVFCQNCNQNERLGVMNHDWNRRINIRATDLDDAFSINYHEGHASLREGLFTEAELTVEANSEVLADLFYGVITPVEPYLDGTLRVAGSEEDIMRLDFISLMIWGE